MDLNELIDLTTSSKKIMYDNCCKELLGHKQVLARIIKAFVDEAKHLSLEEIEDLIGDVSIGNFPLEPHHMQVLNNEDVILGEGTLYYDIRFLLDINDSQLEMRLYIDVEAQNKANPGYPIVTKGIVYSSRMISQQYGIEYDYKSYGELRKVYSIWIMPQAAEYMDGVINTYGIEERQIQGNYAEDIENYDKISIIIVYLSGMHEHIDKYDTHDEILTPLSLLLTNNIKEAKKKKEIMEREYGFDFDERFKKEMKDMCNLSDGIEQAAIERTTKKVTEEVTKKVTDEVTENVTIMYIKNLMDEGDMTMIEAMDLLKLSKEQREPLYAKFS